MTDLKSRQAVLGSHSALSYIHLQTGYTGQVRTDSHVGRNRHGNSEHGLSAPAREAGAGAAPLLGPSGLAADLAADLRLFRRTFSADTLADILGGMCGGLCRERNVHTAPGPLAPRRAGLRPPPPGL